MPISEERIWKTLQEKQGEIPEHLRPQINEVVDGYTKKGEQGIWNIRHQLRPKLMLLAMAGMNEHADCGILYDLLNDVRDICESLLIEDFPRSNLRLWLDN